MAEKASIATAAPKPARLSLKKDATVVRNATVGKAVIVPAPTHEERWNLVAMAAYFRAEQRGFAPGHELSDWMEAEREVDARHPGG